MASTCQYWNAVLEGKWVPKNKDDIAFDSCTHPPTVKVAKQYNRENVRHLKIYKKVRINKYKNLRKSRIHTLTRIQYS